MVVLLAILHTKASYKSIEGYIIKRFCAQVNGIRERYKV